MRSVPCVMQPLDLFVLVQEREGGGGAPLAEVSPAVKAFFCEYLIQRYVKSRESRGREVFRERGVLFALSEVVTCSLCTHRAHKYM